MREKVLSIPRHLTNRHDFPSNIKHKECAHKELKGSEARKPWLKEGSKVLNKSLRINFNFLNPRK